MSPCFFSKHGEIFVDTSIQGPAAAVRRPLQAEPSAVRGAGGGNHVRRRLGPRPRRRGVRHGGLRGGGRGAVQVR